MMAPLPADAIAAAARPGRYRWVICALLFFAITVNYVDRLVLGNLKSVFDAEFGWSETDYGNIVTVFQGAYAIGLLLMGRFMDAVGTRTGLAVAIAAWSLAAMAHGAASSVAHFMLARFALGLGEAGGFPGAIKAVSEWFPKRERAFATGLFNAGSNVGAVLTPLAVPFLVLWFGWQAAFIVTGALGLVLLVCWLAIYRRPEEHPRVGAAELALIHSDPPEPQVRVTWAKALRNRGTWAFMIGKFLTDPIWWLFLFWLPDFFTKTYGLELLPKGGGMLATLGPALIAVYLLADVGSIGGGWLSSRLIARGWSINAGRKTVMLICALCVVPVAFAPSIPDPLVAVGIIGLAAAAHQGWSANLYTVVSDTFPRPAVGTVVGIGGLAGALGGMGIAQFAGWTLQSTGSYVPLMALAGSAYLVALAIIHLLLPRLGETGKELS
ncbi:MFS transporter [Sphingomonas sp. FW199]|uniref:MFS transporter n=1 Tax=Sphingomonas sp. FW199 TaxID=3400217 RepID=UPI003CF99EE5